MRTPSEYQIAPARDFTAGFRLREQIGVLGRWAPPWGMLSVQRYIAAAATLYLMVQLRELWWKPVVNLGFPINVAVGLVLLLGPVVAVVVLLGRWETKNVSPWHNAAGRARLVASSGRSVTEGGRHRQPRRVVVEGCKADIWVRSTWVEPKGMVRYGA